MGFERFVRFDILHSQVWSPPFAASPHLEGKAVPPDAPVCVARRQGMGRQGI